MLKYFEKRRTQRPRFGVWGKVLENWIHKSSKCFELAEMALFLFFRSTQSLISLRPWIALSWERCFAWLCLRSSRSSTHSFHCLYINSKNRTLATGPQRTISAMRRKIYSPGSWQMWLAYTGSNCKLMPGSETGWGWISERRIEEGKGKFINIGDYSEDSNFIMWVRMLEVIICTWTSYLMLGNNDG